MAELGGDKVLKIAFAEMNEQDRKLLERLLADLDDVTAFVVAADGTVVVSLHSPDADEGLSRAFAAAGMLPVSTEFLGVSYPGGLNAC